MIADLDLARALVADPRWRWAAGMRVLEPEYGWTALRLTGADADYWHGCAEDDRSPAGTTWYRVRHDQMHLRVPDLDDPATAGVIVGMLREAVPGWTVEILMLRAHVEVCVGSPGSGGRTVHVDTSLGRAAARAWLSIKERA